MVSKSTRDEAYLFTKHTASTLIGDVLPQQKPIGPPTETMASIAFAVSVVTEYLFYSYGVNKFRKALNV